MKLCCFDDQDFIDKFGEGTCYQDSYFEEGMHAKEMESVEIDVLIQGLSNANQCQLCHDDLQWLDCRSDEIKGLCYKTYHYSM